MGHSYTIGLKPFFSSKNLLTRFLPYVEATKRCRIPFRKPSRRWEAVATGRRSCCTGQKSRLLHRVVDGRTWISSDFTILKEALRLQ